jgi:hypothetical protein
MVKALCYKREDGVFQSWWGRWILQVTLFFQLHCGPGVDSSFKLKDYQNFCGCKMRPARKVDRFTSLHFRYSGFKLVCTHLHSHRRENLKSYINNWYSLIDTLSSRTFSSETFGQPYDGISDGRREMKLTRHSISVSLFRGAKRARFISWLCTCILYIYIYIYIYIFVRGSAYGLASTWYKVSNINYTNSCAVRRPST